MYRRYSLHAALYLHAASKSGFRGPPLAREDTGESEDTAETDLASLALAASSEIENALSGTQKQGLPLKQLVEVSGRYLSHHCLSAFVLRWTRERCS